MKRTIAILLSIAMTACMLSGCGDKGNDPKTSNPPPTGNGDTQTGETTFGIQPLEKRTTLRVGYFSGSLHSCPIYMADEKGWFDELNIDLEYVSFISGPALMEANSSWDVSTTGGPGAIVGVLNYDVKMIGVGDHEAYNAMYVREDSAIYKAGTGNGTDTETVYGSADTLRGTTWIYPVGTTQEIVVNSYLEKFGLTTSDITVINMDCTSALAAFRAGEGDVLGVWLSTAISAEDAGFIKADDGVMNGDVIATTVCATDDALANKFDAVCAFYELYYHASQYCMDNREEFAQYFNETCEIEGVACDENVATKACNSFNGFSLDEMLEYMTAEFDDPMGLASRKLNGGEIDLMTTMDFFVSIDKYTAQNRADIIDKNLVDPVVANAILAKKGA